MPMTIERARILATSVAERLRAHGLLDATVSQASLVDALAKAMDEELSVEYKLNAEIRTLLQEHDGALRHHQADYQQAFDLVKKKLVKERGLVL